MDKNERILLSVAILMVVFIIFYNLFFIPDVKILNAEDYIKYNVNLQTENYTENEVIPNKKGMVNINTATEEELSENINGVGKVIAKRIVLYRETNGGFLNIEEIKNVKGIGNKLYDRIKNSITI